jgi:hypothetical protein
MVSVVVVLAKAGETDEPLDIARKIEDTDFRSRALASVVEALAKAGKTNEMKLAATEAVDATRKIEDVDQRFQTMLIIAEVLAKTRETSDKARIAIEAARQAAEQITKEEVKSAALVMTATVMAKLHLYRQARELVHLNNAPANDKLAAYTAILREYHIEHYPDQAKLFEKEQKED